MTHIYICHMHNSNHSILIVSNIIRRILQSGLNVFDIKCVFVFGAQPILLICLTPAYPLHYDAAGKVILRKK